MNSKKSSIEDVLINDLKVIKKDRDDLLEELKTKTVTDRKDVDHIINIILTGNALIMELESIIERSKESK